ncbi:two-component system sporulation sensor kinase B [Bacillus mesophilus]|uniref:histidine kinase n=1 Tax=Bacillus mesophilus TaxID=1808955 RepID=A0A6M0QA76_9BACI|nr:ATP-binding protein [Bacillus mesophilus]MBM7662660.1 two-component system sporulation sensor kinase B [Bacillus mesophilus]NEY73276.1 two-component sensor histidine kinase [Bacillus mesophilus]
MSVIAKDLIVNLFLFISLLFIYIVNVNITSRYKPYSNFQKQLLVSICILGVILCYFFPMQQTNGTIIDLGLIPIIIAGLYGGWLGYISLLVSSILLILFTSKTFPINLVFIGISFTIFFYYFSPMYLKMRLRLKLITATTLSSLLMGLILWKLHIFSFSWTTSLLFLLAISFGTAIIVYTLELSHNHFLILNHLQRAEKMNVVSHLAASISHEIRNPLTSSRGFLQLLKQPKITDEQRKSYSEIAIQELDQAERIIRDYLTFARPALEQNENLNIQNEIINVVSILTPLANNANVQINVSMMDGWIIGEKTKFQQCLINILKNSIESMATGGCLFITVLRDEDSVIIKIEDHGSGMTSTQMARLGEPYFSTKVKGTGLGMMVVYRIIETMRGTISVKSEVGKGTVFTLIFPSTNLNS